MVLYAIPSSIQAGHVGHLKYFTRRAAIDATTTYPYTTNLNHLLTVPKRGGVRRSIYDPRLKSVRTKDRIRFWNVVPGDQIRIRGDKTNALHEVLSINRLSNRVFVKGAVNLCSRKKSENKVAQTKNFHYSRCQLFVGNYEFPTKDGVGKEVVPNQHETIWNLLRGRFAWKRAATKTVPRIPWETGYVNIPWPKVEKPTLPEPTSYDTSKDVVTQVTYKTINGPLPRAPSEDEFLTALYNPAYNPDFSSSRNSPTPHARAKKAQRWKMRKSLQKARLDEIIEEGMKHPDGRTEREIRAESAFRTKKEQQKKMRWKDRVADARKKVKKEERQRRKLTELQLDVSEPNQFIPKDI
ncbi:hypothetical protein FA13DRAFT_1760444 [Coprinellus micaceus]|uniref:KOW domain-containing protein n=1 Tax=Coprinellus micaceus TaxID=71717 RepID=A0A4Y7R4N4_COPMI|nr:hypothetical protein FA13DRAFT_1760444 [Coprinellus micaceus]